MREHKRRLKGLALVSLSAAVAVAVAAVILLVASSSSSPSLFASAEVAAEGRKSKKGKEAAYRDAEEVACETHVDTLTRYASEQAFTIHSATTSATPNTIDSIPISIHLQPSYMAMMLRAWKGTAVNKGLKNFVLY